MGVRFKHFASGSRVPFLLLFLSTVLVSPASIAAATKVDLPASYCDFALNPETGDLVALDPERDRAVLFKEAALAAGGAAAPAVETRVGSKPSSVFFKSYGETDVFAVVCIADANMYILNASDLSLLKKIPLDQSGVHQVTGSTNPEDPYVYYCYGRSHGSFAGAVSLADMSNKGVAFEEAGECAISASGQIAYRRRLGSSPSGFESLARVDHPGDGKPIFVRLFYDHESTRGYTPDPFGELTAVDKDLYDPTLMRKVATADFYPTAFFRTKPVMLGRAEDAYRRGGSKAVEIFAGSTNSFARTGRSVKLDFKAPKVERRSDPNKPANRERLFADDGRARAVFAAMGSVYLVPLGEFEPADEPLMLVRRNEDSPLLVGEQGKIQLVPLAEGITVEVEDAPPGAKVEGPTVTWTPPMDAVGKHHIAVSVGHGALQRLQRIEIEVVYPGVELPFSPAGIRVTADGGRAIIWEGPEIDRWGRVESGTEVATPRIAVLELPAAKVLAERKLAAPFADAVLVGDLVALRGAEQSSQRCELLSIADLERKETLVTERAIRSFEAYGSMLVVITNERVEVFDTRTVEKVYEGDMRFSALQQRPPVSEHGIFVDGVLHDGEFKPKLIVYRGDEAAGPLLQGGINAPPEYLVVPPSRTGNSDGVIGGAIAPGSSTKITLKRTQERNPVAGGTHTWHITEDVVVSADTEGGTNSMQRLARVPHYSRRDSRAYEGPLPWAVTPQAVYVVSGSTLYTWGWDRGADGQGLRWTKKQSALTLDPSGKTVLTHELDGRDADTKVVLAEPKDGLSLDPQTLEVTIDNAVFIERASEFVGQQFGRWMQAGETLEQTIERTIPRVSGRATRLLGRAPKGVPVMVPVRLNASGAKLDSAALDYFVMVELGEDATAEISKKFDEARLKAQAARASQQAAANKGGGAVAPIDLDPVFRRLDSADAKADEQADRIKALEVQREELLRRVDELEEEVAAVGARAGLLTAVAPFGLVLGIAALVLALRPRRGAG